MSKLKLSGIVKTTILVFTILIFGQCMRDEFDFNKLSTDLEINSGILMPLAYGSLSFDNIVSEFDSSGFLSEDADGLLYLTYANSLTSFKADSILAIPEQDFFQFFIDTDFDFSGPGWTTVSDDSTQNFPFTFKNNEELDSMIVKTGDLIFEISSDFQHTGQIVMTFPNITLNGNPLVKTVPMNDPSGNFSEKISEPIDGYTIHLNDSVGSDSLFLPVDFYVELNETVGNPILGTDSIRINAKISALEFEAIFGYIGDIKLLSETGNLGLGFFDSPMEGYIEFEEPIINLNIQNSYGVPAAITLKDLIGYNNDGDSAKLEFGAEDSLVFRHAYPKLSDYKNSDIVKDTTVSIDNENSNLSEFLAYRPSSLKYNMSALSNPDGKGTYNFVLDESEINVGFEFVLPLYFKADSFALNDTIDFDLFQDADFIEKITLKLEVTNGLPIDIDFQIAFVDSLYNPIDYLFDSGYQPVIPSATLNDDETVQDPTIKTSLIEFTGTDISKMETVKYGIIRAGLKTPDDDGGNLLPVKFYSDYTVDFNLSVRVDVKANIND